MNMMITMMMVFISDGTSTRTRIASPLMAPFGHRWFRLTISAHAGIVLKKSFWGGERKFLEPLMRFARGDVRDHFVSSKIDHGPP